MLWADLVKAKVLLPCSFSLPLCFFSPSLSPFLCLSLFLSLSSGPVPGGHTSPGYSARTACASQSQLFPGPPSGPADQSGGGSLGKALPLLLNYTASGNKHDWHLMRATGKKEPIRHPKKSTLIFLPDALLPTNPNFIFT